VPDRRYADEWLPSRFSLATLRLTAFVIASLLVRKRPTSGAYLNRTPQQHPLEAYLLALAYWLIPTAQLALLTLQETGWPGIFALPVVAALLVLVPLAWVLIALTLTPAARALSEVTGRSTHDIQALVTPAGMLLLAVTSIVRHWPAEILGWLWIALTVIEVVASIICVLLRGRFEALEERLPAVAP